MAQVTILRGEYRNNKIKNQTFRLVADLKQGAKGNYVTIEDDGSLGYPGKAIRVKVKSMEDITVSGQTVADMSDSQRRKAAKDDGSVFSIVKPAEPEVYTESEEAAIERIRERFDILDEMSEGCTTGAVRAMIVSGPPGVGKSFGVEKVLEQASLFDKMAQRKNRFEVVKGAMSAIGLYAKLFKFSDPNNVLVFDDCDSILLDDLSLNILKAALDSSKKRYISWNTDSSMLRREGVPDRFEFKGSVIFITNIKFEHVRSKKLKDHLDALESRCHYLDLTLDTQRDKFLRIKQIVRDGMLDSYDFDDGASDEIVDYVWEQRARLRELSLRTVLKIADLRKMSAHNWKRLAETTILKRAEA
jgi:ATPase family associated with various cellular activities (AAA)